MNIKFKYCFPILTIFLLLACETTVKKNTVLEEGLTASYHGKIVITEIADAANGKEGYLEIYFKFIPSDRSAMQKYLCVTCPDTRQKLFYDNRDIFHSNWVTKWDIRKGSEYQAIRHELRRKDNSNSVSFEVFLEPK